MCLLYVHIFVKLLNFMQLSLTLTKKLPDSVLKNPFYDFHSMFQQFNPSIRSRLHITINMWYYYWDASRGQLDMALCCTFRT